MIKRHGNSSSDVQWFSAAGAFVFHVVNSWEVAATTGPLPVIVIVASRYEDMSLDFVNLEHFPVAGLYEWRLDLNNGKVAEGPLGSALPSEFGVVPLAKLGRPAYV